MIDLPILFEDSWLLVVDKPPGIVVNRAESVHGETVQDWALLRLGFGGQAVSADESDFYSRAGIVHRIDKETSGCLIIAKDPHTFVDLQRQFKERSIQKTYLAIVHGRMSPDRGEIRAPVGRLPWNRERFGVLPGGKDAVTNYVVKQSWMTSAAPKTREELSLVELHPETGRTHQIRVHLKYINHPIVGDFQYAGRKTSRADRLWAIRVLLHAWKIVFTHPDKEAATRLPAGRLAIEAPIPDDMKRVIPQDLPRVTG